MKTAADGREAEIYGGDAFYTTIDPDHSQNIIEEYTYAEQVNLSTDGGGSWYSITPGSSCGTRDHGPVLDSDRAGPDDGRPRADRVHADPGGDQRLRQPVRRPRRGPRRATARRPTRRSSPCTTCSTLPSPNGAPNIPSAVGVRGANEYVAYCGYCDPATQGIPFANGIATNVGGSAPPQIGSSAGWHQASALCSDCQTANGKLPERYINSIQEDPNDPNTVYVTLGGYGRRWIPPGLLRRGHEQRRRGPRVRLPRPRRALHQHHRQPARHLGQLDRVPQRPADRRHRPRRLRANGGGHRHAPRPRTPSSAAACPPPPCSPPASARATRTCCSSPPTVAVTGSTRSRPPHRAAATTAGGPPAAGLAAGPPAAGPAAGAPAAGPAAAAAARGAAA